MTSATNEPARDVATNHAANPAGRMSTPFHGALVRTTREARGMSATALHKAINQAGYPLSLSGLTRVERGGGTSPETAQAIADALGVPLSTFLGRPRKGRGEHRFRRS